MRKDPLVTGEYYHIYNRGVDKRDIFMNSRNLNRFILSVKSFNTVKPIGSIREVIDHQSNPTTNFTDVKRLQNLIVDLPDSPLVSIVCYCFNPNHFHFLLKQEVDGGISEFFKRLLGGYTKYFNEIYNRNGSLFQGTFKSNLINNDQYLLIIQPYVHMNYSIHEIPKNKNHLVWASDEEYNSNIFDIVSKKEAEKVLNFYGSNENFKNECLEVTSAIRKQRGKTSLLKEDSLP